MQADWPPLNYVHPITVPRPHSRRSEGRLYMLERLSRDASRARHLQRAPECVVALAEAGRTGSAFRRRLKERGLDPKLARLVLLFDSRRRMRVAEVAWALNVSPSTASRWLDRAEREGLIDKVYDSFDRRGTWARLTRLGVDLRDHAQRILEDTSTNVRPAGVVWGQRSARGREE